MSEHTDIISFRKIRPVEAGRTEISVFTANDVFVAFHTLQLSDDTLRDNAYKIAAYAEEGGEPVSLCYGDGPAIHSPSVQLQLPRTDGEGEIQIQIGLDTFDQQLRLCHQAFYISAQPDQLRRFSGEMLKLPDAPDGASAQLCNE